MLHDHAVAIAPQPNAEAGCDHLAGNHDRKSGRIGNDETRRNQVEAALQAAVDLRVVETEIFAAGRVIGRKEAAADVALIGLLAGVIAKFIMPGDNEPSGFILTTILGIVGAFVATYLGQALGWYRPGEGAGLIGAVVGAIIVLLVYGLVAGGRQRAI